MDTSLDISVDASMHVNIDIVIDVHIGVRLNLADRSDVKRVTRNRKHALLAS